MAETVNEYRETDLGNVAPNPRGDYSETAEYEYLDLVAYAGGSYMCILAEGTVTGTAPTPGKTTEIWQEVSRPGNLTPEYVAMHDDVVNKAASVAEDAASVAADRVQVEGMKENVAALQEQTAQDAQLTKVYRESAAGYASAAETSRMAAGESEENIRALVNGFDAHVEEQKTSAQEDITTSRQAAIKAIASQQVLSVNAVKQEGQKAIDKTNADAEATAADRAAVSEKAATVDGQAAQVAQNAAQVAEDKATAENYMQTAGESKKQALEAAEHLKDSVNLVQKNTVDLQGKAPVIIGSATSYDGSPVEVNDSAEMQLQGLRLYGKSLQETTTGKNLSSIKSCQLSTNMVSSDIVPWTKKDRIYFSCDTENVDGSKIYVICRYYNESKIRVGANGTILLADGTRKEISFRGVGASSHGGDVDLTTIEYVNIEIGLSSASTAASSIDNIMVCDEENQTYEPYTGGKPSPSPEYPQEIVSVGGNGSIDVEITGRNYVNKNKFEATYEHKDGYYYGDIYLQYTNSKLYYDISDFKNGHAYKFSATVKTIDKKVHGLVFEYMDGTFTRGDENILENTEKTISVVSDKTKIIKACYINYGEGTKVYIKDDISIIDVDEQSIATIHISNGLPGIPVTTGGNYTDENGQQYICDEIDFARGKKVQRIWKGVFDGSSDEKWAYDNEQRARMILNNGNLGTYVQRDIASMCSNLLWNRNVYLDSNRENGYLINNDTLFVRVTESLALNTEPDFRTWLASNPVTFQYVLATPIKTDLTEAQIQAYKSLTTFKPTSIISNDAGAQMEVEYACDTKTYIDNKLQEIAQALVASASEAE